MNEQLKPSYNLDLEKAVLGAIMLESATMDLVLGIIRKKEVFYDISHQVIFEACKALYDASKPIDILTVTQQLASDGNLEKAQGRVYVTQLTSRVNSSANVEYHARIVLQHWIKRRIMVVAHRAYTLSMEESTDGLELLDKIDNAFLEITSDFSSGTTKTLKETVPESINDIGESMGGGIQGMMTNLYDFDEKIGGYKKGELYILAARPGQGKTSLAITQAVNASLIWDKKIAFFSIEMSYAQLTKRIISFKSEINVHKLINGKLSQTDYDKMIVRSEQLLTDNVFINDKGAQTVSSIKAECKRIKRVHGLDAVFIDYLQLMSGDGNTREQEISKISRGLKELSKELDVPIIALSQLSRAVETRGGAKRPILSDLRESGAIEQDADMVMFLYRPEYYDIMEDDEGNSTEGLAELIISKFRNGSSGTVDLFFEKQFTYFKDWK